MAEDVWNSTLPDGQIAWSKHAAQSPPRRDYGYDPSFAGVSGQPPFAPPVSVDGSGRNRCNRLDVIAPMLRPR